MICSHEFFFRDAILQVILQNLDIFVYKQIKYYKNLPRLKKFPKNIDSFKKYLNGVSFKLVYPIRYKTKLSVQNPLILNATILAILNEPFGCDA